MVHVAEDRRPVLRHGRHGHRPELAAVLARTPLRLTGMPIGTRHEIVGLLLRDHDEFVVDVVCGGTWRLDLGWRTGWQARRMVGQRVRATGIRDGFDLLAVKTIDRTR